MHTRRYSAFISYRHADNTQEGRRWAEWLHRGLERYVVPPDLIGTPNLRGEPIRDSLYPIFRDEDELPANADLATGIRAALEVSDHLIVLCSPRSAVSPWVRKEVREFKELGRCDRILTIIIAGEPNADDPAKVRAGVMRDEECFCEELRFGAVREDGTLDWSIRTEPTSADFRPSSTRDEGFVTAEAYREYLTLNSSFSLKEIATLTEAYRQRLDLSLLKMIAGLLGVTLGQLKDRDAVHRAAIAKKELERAEAEAARLRAAYDEVEKERTATQAALNESNRQLERSQVEEGRAWLERGRTAKNQGEHARALLLAGRAIGYQGFGRKEEEAPPFTELYPPLLSQAMQDPVAEQDCREEAAQTTQFLDSTYPTLLPLWAMKEAVSCVTFSPDGSRLASDTEENTIKLWDAATGKELTSLQGHTNMMTGVVFSPDGNRLASGSEDDTIRLWDAATGKELASLEGHTNYVWSIAFSPDGSRLASGSEDKTIKLWDAASGKQLASLKGHMFRVTSVAFSPDGSRLASGSVDDTIKLWDTASGKELASLKGHTNWVSSVAFSPDGNHLASGSKDKTIKLWDGASGKELASLQGHTGEINCIAFSPDGSHLASGSEDKTIKLWDAASSKELASLQGHTNTVIGVAFSPDGISIASGSWDNTIKLWDAATGKELASLQGHTSTVWSVAFSPDGSRLASCAADRTIKLWDAALGKELPLTDPRDLAKAKQWLTATKQRLHPNGQRLAEIYGNTICIVPSNATLDLAAPLRAGLAAFDKREVVFPTPEQTTPMIHYRQDTYAQLADPQLAPEQRAELRMELCVKAGRFRAATAQWLALSRGEWPGPDQSTSRGAMTATISADSPIRRLYLLALIDATKHPQIHGHPTICQTATQIAPVLTKEMMATPTISLAMMSLMQTLAKDDSPDMSAPRAALLKRLEEVATAAWLAVLRESSAEL